MLKNAMKNQSPYDIIKKSGASVGDDQVNDVI
jgi:hypothetical protein